MLYKFPTPFVYWEQLPEHDSIKDELLEDIMDDADGNGESYRERMSKVWNCDVTTSFFRYNPLEFLTEDHYKTIVWGPYQRMFDEFGSDLPQPERSGLHSVWYNHYTSGQYQEIHSHVSGQAGLTVLYSGIYILDMKDDVVNPTTFFYPNLCPVYLEGPNKEFSTPKLKAGSVLIFPSSLTHYVNPSPCERTTLSFNIKVI